MERHGGILPIPPIIHRHEHNNLIQLQSSIGNAIQCFPGATAIHVPYERFIPYRNIEHLLLFRSDAYILEKNHYLIELNPECGNSVPHVILRPPGKPTQREEEEFYRFFLNAIEGDSGAIPSLKHCRNLAICGKVRLNGKCVFVGNVMIINNDVNGVKDLPHGVIADRVLDLSDPGWSQRRGLDEHNEEGVVAGVKNPCFRLCSIL